MLQAKLKAEALAIETVRGGDACEGCGLGVWKEAWSLQPCGTPSALTKAPSKCLVVCEVLSCFIHLIPALKVRIRIAHLTDACSHTGLLSARYVVFLQARS